MKHLTVDVRVGYEWTNFVVAYDWHSLSGSHGLVIQIMLCAAMQNTNVHYQQQLQGMKGKRIANDNTEMTSR